MRRHLAIAVFLLLGSTAAAEERDMANVLAGADWSKMETVNVTMTEYAFSPSPIALKSGAPTKIVLRNGGKEHHYFVAEKFFRTIATRKIQGSDGEVKAPAFTAVEVYAGKSMEWFLVPTEKGTFDVVCTVKGHADHGMKGTIEVR
ncbi:MAG TPA: cupredoxin domain-containing protein [Candidatus Deferrimicrobiaceae bacterium]